MAPKAILMKTGLGPHNTTRPVNTAHPKTTVHNARPMFCFSKSAQSTIKRPSQERTTLTNKSVSQKVNTATRKFYTAWPIAVNTTRPNSAVVNAIRGYPQMVQEDQGYVNSGCSRHMTGNMSYLFNFKEFDGGYVTFRGGASGGRITGKGTLKTGKLDFKDVYFVKELKFNLLSVLLKVRRKNNMYSVDIKNIVPKESLTCLVAKAILDDSMLWHINFKNINKLVKDNLVRSIPSKCFENDQTCVACLKGKQHKASSSKDETLGILKKFITEIENLVHKKVKVIRCDNGTEFKNSVINDFCAMKGIRREFSVARTPQQNSAEAVNIACYVQNRALIVKPHNKTPYELFRGRTPARSFMRPFGCHVIILNTLDHLDKFDGKANEDYFVGYSMNSKAFRVYNIRTSRVEENLHIEFLKNKPIVAGAGPKWLFDIDMLTESMNYVPVIAGIKSIDFADKESGALNVLNSAFENLNTKYPDDPKIPGLETIATNDDSKEEVDFTNLESLIQVSPIPTTKIHKNHLLKQMDVKSDFFMEGLKRRSMIGSLMYLTTSRPNIMYTVCVCSRFQVTPKVSHLHAIKRIFTYLKGHLKLRIWYPRNSPFELVAYTDSDYAGASLHRKSTTGGCQFLGSRLLSWQCKKKTVVDTSTNEAKYVAAASCYGQILSIWNQMLDYGYNFMHAMIYIDNNSTICIAKNPVYHSLTKDIEIRHHFI
nr:putative reverse transcriptase, RNA-dependent DNA polymerase [Tanacetum cinerariifolium]